MRITLELNENQAKVLQESLETTLKSLMFQEVVIQEELEKFGDGLFHEDGSEVTKKKEKEFNYLNDYLAKLTPQRILVAEILGTVKEADEKTSIVTGVGIDTILESNRKRRK